MLSALKFISFQTTFIWVQENKYQITVNYNVQDVVVMTRYKQPHLETGKESKRHILGCWIVFQCVNKNCPVPFKPNCSTIRQSDIVQRLWATGRSSVTERYVTFCYVVNFITFFRYVLTYIIKMIKLLH